MLASDPYSTATKREPHRLRRLIFFLVSLCPVPGRSENSGADVDAEAQAPDQPARGAGSQHGARSDGAQRRLEAHQGADARQVRLVVVVSKGALTAVFVGRRQAKSRCAFSARTRGRGLLDHRSWTNKHVAFEKRGVRGGRCC